MLCLNMPKKATSAISVWGSMILILVAALLCFQPMFTLSVDTKTLDGIDDMLAEMGEDDISISDFVGEDHFDLEVSIVDLASAVSLLVKIVPMIDDEDVDFGAELEKLLDSEEAQKTLLMATAIAVTFTNAIDIESFGNDIDNMENATNENEMGDAAKSLANNILIIVLKMLLILVALLVVLGLTVIIPIRCCFSALTALISALVHVTKPEVASPKLAKRLPSLLKMPLLLILFSCLVPELGVGSGAMGIIYVCFGSVLLAVLLSRLHSYTPAQMKYANVMQGVSIVGVVGYLVFFFNVIKVGAFASFVNGGLAKHVMNIAIASYEGKTISSAANLYILDIVFILLAVLFVLISRGYLSSCLRRLSCAIVVKEGKSSIKDIILPRAILMLPIYILPKLVMDSNNYFEDVTASKGTASLLVLNAEQQSAFDGVLVGIVIVLVAEIAMIVLRAALCHDVSKVDKGLVMSGNACAVDAPAKAEEAPAAEEDVAAMAEAPAEEASAEEASVEEAPAEEAPAEEAPAEEAPAEEAPAEEAPAEEAPAEEAPAEEAPAEEAPAEEAPVEEASADEAPFEDTPAEENTEA